MKKILSALLLGMAFKVFAVPEIPEPVNDIAITTVRNGEVVILYNPDVCKRLGALVCSFFRAHEYGHVYRGHLITKAHPQQAEFEADCWAAKNAPLAQVQAAYQHFMNEGFMGDWSHGTGHQRAQRLATCAQTRPGWKVVSDPSETASSAPKPMSTPAFKTSSARVADARARLVRLSEAIYFTSGKYSEMKELLFADKDPCEITFYERGFYPDSNPTFDLRSRVFFAKGIDAQRIPLPYESTRFVKDYLAENVLGSKYHHVTQATMLLPEIEHAYVPEIFISSGPLKYWAVIPIVGERKVERGNDYDQSSWLSFTSAKDRDAYFDLLVELQNACLNKPD